MKNFITDPVLHRQYSANLRGNNGNINIKFWNSIPKTFLSIIGDRENKYEREIN